MTTLSKWAVLEQAPSYEISSDGRLRRCKPGRRPCTSLEVGQELRLTLSNTYYHATAMTPSGGRLTVHIHVAVCTAFHGPKPTPRHQVAHLNGDPTDNRAENLAWVTPVENVAHKYAHGTMPFGDAGGKNKLTTEQVLEIRSKKLCRRRDYIDYGTRFGVHPQTIARAARGETWSHLPKTRDVVRTIGVKK